MKIISVNIGKKREIDYKGTVIKTGIFKKPVSDSLFLDIEEVANDEVMDRKRHGGVKQAVYAYGENHYGFWKDLFPDLVWHYGMFGENLTVSNLEETKIKVGNVYNLGETIIEASKPRTPCFKLGLVFKTQSVLKQFWNSTKCGVYFKVLKTGNVNISDKLILVKEMVSSPTIAEVYQSK